MTDQTDWGAAADAIRRFGQTFKPLIDASDAMSNLGAMQDAATAADKSLTANRAELAKVQAELAAEKALAGSHKAEADAYTANVSRETAAAKADADAYVADRRKMGADVLENAKKNAGQIIAEAHSAGEDHRAQVEADLEGHHKAIDAAVGRREALGAEIDRLTALRDELKAKLTAVAA